MTEEGGPRRPWSARRDAGGNSPAAEVVIRTSLGRAIWEARARRGWNSMRLASEATAVAARLEPSLGIIFGYQQIHRLERFRATIAIDDPRDPLRYVMRALGLGPDVLAKAVGL